MTLDYTILANQDLQGTSVETAADRDLAGNRELSDAVKRFNAACSRIISLTPRPRHGIGMQSEKALHAVLKNYVDDEEDHQEIPVDNYIADIYHDGKITEIQTANMGAMRAKLSCFLPRYPVRILYPLPAEKWVVWIDPDTGEISKRNKSPLRGSFFHAFKELYRIRPFLTDKNLSLELLLIDLDEYRLLDGWSRDRKRGSHRYERIPVRLRDRMVLDCPRDYMQFVPEGLPEPFTSADFAGAVRFRKKGISTVLLILTEMGVIERVGKKGNYYLYRVTQDW